MTWLGPTDGEPAQAGFWSLWALHAAGGEGLGCTGTEGQRQPFSVEGTGAGFARLFSRGGKAVKLLPSVTLHTHCSTLFKLSHITGSSDPRGHPDSSAGQAAALALFLQLVPLSFQSAHGEKPSPAAFRTSLEET